MAYTRAQIREQIRQRCGIENSTVQTNNELNAHINDAAAYVHDFLIATYSENYAVGSDTFTTTAGVTQYAPTLSPEFAYLLSVRLTFDDLEFPLGTFSLVDEVRRTSGYSWGAGWLPRYTSVRDPGGDIAIIFDPPPDTTHTVTLFYHTKAPEYTSDSDTVDIPHTDLLVVEACIRVKDKEERDATRFMQERSLIQKRIEDWVGAIDRGEPPHTLRAKRNGRSRWIRDREF